MTNISCVHPPTSFEKWTPMIKFKAFQREIFIASLIAAFVPASLLSIADADAMLLFDPLILYTSFVAVGYVCGVSMFLPLVAANKMSNWVRNRLT